MKANENKWQDNRLTPNHFPNHIKYKQLEHLHYKEEIGILYKINKILLYAKGN